MRFEESCGGNDGDCNLLECDDLQSGNAYRRFGGACYVQLQGKRYITVFGVITPCNVAGSTNVSEEAAASIFKV
jgi:hypothetical protein